MRDTIQSMLTHLGGEDYASEPQRMLSRRVGAFEAELIHLEDKFARARAEGREPVTADFDLYSRMSSAQRRLLEAVGLSSRATRRHARPLDLCPRLRPPQGIGGGHLNIIEAIS